MIDPPSIKADRNAQLTMDHKSTPNRPPGRGLSLRATLSLFSVAALGAALVIGATSIWGQYKSDVTAIRTFTAKDVTADILPPPLYLIEMRLVLSQAAEGTLPIERAKEELLRLQDEYLSRTRYWGTQSQSTGLEARLLGEQHRAATAFILVAQRTLDAIAQGNMPAVRGALREADQRYLAHRMQVDVNVAEARRFMASSLAEYEKTQRMVRWTQGVVLVLTVIGLAGLGWWLRQMVWSAVGGEPADAAAVARAVAMGNLSVQIPVEPGDQHSIMAAMREMFEHASTKDPLTGALNRNGFEKALDAVFSGQPATRPAAVVMLDLDYFKPINDTLGHAAGDAMLVAVTRAIRGHARSSDVLARLGGDEFALLLPNCDQTQAMAIAESLRQAIGSIALEPDDNKTQTARISASIGVAELSTQHQNTAQWVAQADEYCYLAKNEGRNRVCGASATPPARAPRREISHPKFGS